MEIINAIKGDYNYISESFHNYLDRDGRWLLLLNIDAYRVIEYMMYKIELKVYGTVQSHLCTKIYSK